MIGLHCVTKVLPVKQGILRAAGGIPTVDTFLPSVHLGVMRVFSSDVLRFLTRFMQQGWQQKKGACTTNEDTPDFLMIVG